MAGVGPKLELRQGQSLVMTPQLQQAIKLLQLSNLELTEYVEVELERNPLLEREDADGAPADSGAVEAGAENSGEAINGEASLESTLGGENFTATGDLDAGRDDL